MTEDVGWIFRVPGSAAPEGIGSQLFFPASSRPQYEHTIQQVLPCSLVRSFDVLWPRLFPCDLVAIRKNVPDTVPLTRASGSQLTQAQVFNLRQESLMWRSLVTPVVLMFLAGSAHAVVVPDDVQAVLDQRFEAFVVPPVFTVVAPGRLDEGWWTPARFPNPRTDTIFPEDAGINAATKALMLVESQEPVLPHARYRVTYRLDNAPDFGSYANAYIEVTRFNLGPARYADTVDSTPEGVPVAPSEEFGIGPSVSWRFVMGWVQGGTAVAVHASRSELSPPQAQLMNCLGAPCVALENPHGPSAPDDAWKRITPPPMEPVTYVSQVNGRPTAAWLSELLFQHASTGQSNIEALDMHGAEPQLIFVISMDVEGQDPIPTALLHQQLLRDDAISNIWTRVGGYDADTLDWREYIEYWPGRS